MSDTDEAAPPRAPLEDSDAAKVAESTAAVSNSRLGLIVFGLWLSLFLCSLETTIVSTSLVHIANDLKDANDSGWIVVVYLLTFNTFILIWAKLSDTFGTKWLLLLANCIFCVFSIGCALSKTMTQLIVFRAFQGMGGSGMYSLVFVIIAQIVPMDKLGICTGILGSVFALASLLGPVLGGVISDRSTWRWIFWLNVPGVAAVFAILVKAMPGTKSKEQVQSSMKTLDIFGALLSLAWVVPLLFALEEGGHNYKWNSGIIIGTLATGIAMLIVFGLWENWTHRYTKNESLFPVGLLKRPVVVVLFLCLLLTGFTFYVPIIQIPQRFQHVNNTTATRAGILLLPLTLVSPVTAMIAGSLVGRHRLWAPGLTLLGSCLSLAGIALMGSLPNDSAVPSAQFGYQVLIGLSLGLLTPSLLYILKLEVDGKEIAGGMGVGNMCRTLGGCVGLAVCGAILQARLDEDLPKFLDPRQIAAVYTSSSQADKLLTRDQLAMVGEVYGDGYNMEFRGLIAFSGFNILTVLMLCYYHIKSGASWPKAEHQGKSKALIRQF